MSSSRKAKIGKVTSFEVAAMAGVSQSTVSRALRDHGGVSAETRDRIHDAAARLSYVPDRGAAHLRSGSTGTIAIVILSGSGGDGAGVNPLYLSILAATGVAAAVRGYDLLVVFETGGERLKAEPWQARDADGIIVLGGSRNRAAWGRFTEARERGEPVVCWGAPNDFFPTVRCDNFEGADRAVRHLIERGRRRIGLVAPGWRNHAAYRQRREGYLESLARVKLPPLLAPDAAASTRETQGHRCMLALLEAEPEVDAIFAACDLLAIGALRALREAGRLVPEDVALVGFDGIASADHVHPGLTTMEQDTAIAGERLVEALIALMQGGEPDLRAIPVKLVVRGSSAAATP